MTSATMRITSTANPGTRVIITMPGGEETGILCIVPGSMNDTLTGDGRAQTTFDVFAKNYPVNIREAVNRLDSLLSRAAEITESGTADDLIVLRISTKNESFPREARIYGGRIVARDSAGFDAYFENGATAFTVTLERDSLWSVSTDPSEQTWTAVNALGGTREIDGTITDGSAPGRIELMRIDPKTGKFAEAWVGIKPNLVGGLEEFDPVVSINSSNADNTKVSVNQVNSDFTPDVYSYFIDGVGTRVRWVTSRDGKTLPAATVAENIKSQEMVYKPLRSWNTNAQTAANRNQWIGQYRVLLRWAGTLDSSAKFVFRLSTGWAASNANVQQTPLAPVYKRAPGGTEFHMVQLGTVTVGGAMYGAAAQRRNVIDSFTLGLDVAIMGLDPDSSSFVNSVANATLYIDKFILIPAEHTFHARYAAGEIVPGYQMEYQQLGPDQQAVMVTTNYESPALWIGGEGQVVDTVPEFDTNNFVMPTEDGSVMVLVTDRPWGQTQALNANRLLSFAVVKRARNYAR